MLVLRRQIQDFEGVPNQPFFDFEVDLRARPEAGHVIHLQEARFEALVDEDVEAQNLETGVVEGVVGLRGGVVVLQDGLDAADRLHNDVLDFRPNRRHGVARLGQLREEVQDASFVAAAVLGVVGVLGFDEFWVVFVDCEICEVDEILGFVGVCDLFVLFCGQADQSVFVEEDSERVAGCYEDVDSEVEFEVFVQKWAILGLVALIEGRNDQFRAMRVVGGR